MSPFFVIYCRLLVGLPTLPERPGASRNRHVPPGLPATAEILPESSGESWGKILPKILLDANADGKNGEISLHADEEIWGEIWRNLNFTRPRRLGRNLGR